VGRTIDDFQLSIDRLIDSVHGNWQLEIDNWQS
jgi:hypothetical protein